MSPAHGAGVSRLARSRLNLRWAGEPASTRVRCWRHATRPRPPPRPPARRGAAHAPRPDPVDVDLALRQWDSYVAALRAEGWETIEVPAADDCPDAVFVEDTVVAYGDLAVITRPGAEERRAGDRDHRGDAARARLPDRPDRAARDPRRRGRPQARRHRVGGPRRTNRPGRGRPAGRPPRAAGCAGGAGAGARVLHLKSAVTALPDGTVVGHEPLVDDPTVWDPFLPVPEESGGHVVLLGGGTLLMATDAPRSRELFEQRGLRVVAVDISEFERLEGCVTCLSVRLR